MQASQPPRVGDQALTISQGSCAVSAHPAINKCDEDSTQTYRCLVCLQQRPLNDAVTLEACGHQFCPSCVLQYLQQKINDGDVRPRCFHPTDHGQCGEPVSDHQIQSLVSDRMWRKRAIFLITKEHQFGRQCPYCFHPQACHGPESPVCECQQCGKSFCFFHSNAHEATGDCATYEKSIASAEALVQRISKSCPECHSSVEKDGGCNHMTCVVCDTSFCWLCGERLDGVTSHFSIASGTRCAGRQFNRSSSGNAVTVNQALATVVRVLLEPLMVFTKLISAASSIQIEGSLLSRLKAHAKLCGYGVCVTVVAPVALVGVATSLVAWLVVDTVDAIAKKVRSAWRHIRRIDLAQQQWLPANLG